MQLGGDSAELSCLCSEHKQGPLHAFDEADLSTAQMALSTDPDRKEAQAEESASHSRLAFRRRLSDMKRQLQKARLVSYLFTHYFCGRAYHLCHGQQAKAAMISTSQKIIRASTEIKFPGLDMPLMSVLNYQFLQKGSPCTVWELAESERSHADLQSSIAGHYIGCGSRPLACRASPLLPQCTAESADGATCLSG